jgi:3-hydroxybutyrate dehydrogenase
MALQYMCTALAVDKNSMIKWVVGTVALLGAFLLIKNRKKKRLLSKGKCILITGCDSGVGLTLALHAKSLGFHVIATCLNESSDGAEMLKGKDILAIQMDVTENDDIRSVKDSVEKYLNENHLCLWAIINNAGVLIYGHFEWQVESQVLQQINVNMLGTFNVTKTFLPLLRFSQGWISREKG